ncbi:hypothetical protein [Mycobacterium sp. 852002-10029_SCH5224772]|uniref:hypothetical protein n=1 Tax=Mycobacterium sp. 852002-10029_SCH5224772 TaxID=1834083 RepID=UPI000A97F33C|nr:hypothetical protein [Mycobacterium sp. 852002-10029_SCH5224772]
MRTAIGDFTARELIDELVRRHGAPEVRRMLELPESTDLHQLADGLDRWVR